jgi:hypothetical protein
VAPPLDDAKGASHPPYGGEASGSSTALLSEDEQNSLLNNWKATMDPWRDMRSTMPRCLYTFASVATHEGLGVQEYADLAGVAQSVVSRHLLDLAHAIDIWTMQHSR